MWNYLLVTVAEGNVEDIQVCPEKVSWYLPCLPVQVVDDHINSKS